MIVCKLMGGLGNQMFQYAYASELSKRLNDELCFDIDSYGEKKPAIFNLDITHRNTVNQIELHDFEQARKAAKIYHVLQYVIRKLNHEKIGINLFQTLSKRGYYFNFDPFFYPSIPCNRKNKYVYGYFQGTQYFETINEEIKKQFNSNISDVAKKYEIIIKGCNAIAVHIRLGDYCDRKNRYLNVCTDTYYAKGINYIRENVEEPIFFIFTNDPNSVKEKNYIPKNAIFVEGTKDYEDLMLMKMCRNFVISGSTFSWWGSYLSENSNKVTVIPKVWMTTLRHDPAIIKRTDLVRIDNK